MNDWMAIHTKPSNEVTTGRKPHKHAAIIKAWADGAAVEFRNGPEVPWVTVQNTPSWFDIYEYRVKPEPESNMSDDELLICYYRENDLNLEQIKKSGFAPLLRRVADEAVRRYVKETANKS